MPRKTQTKQTPAKQQSTNQMKQVEPKDLKKDDLILDIRTHVQHAKMALKRPHWHVPTADIDIKDFIKHYYLDGKKTLNIICTSGHKASEIARQFAAAGFKNVAVVTGGIMHAKEQGVAMIEHASMPLEQQVHLTAGILIIVGMILAYVFSSLFYVIPLLVGIGFVVSGLTGHCTMSAILKEMPWNQ